MGRKEAWKPVSSLVEGLKQRHHRRVSEKMLPAIARSHGGRRPTAIHKLFCHAETRNSPSLTQQQESLLEGAGPEAVPLSI